MHCPCCCTAKGGVSGAIFALIIVAVVVGLNAHSFLDFFNAFVLWGGITMAIVMPVSITFMVRAIIRDSRPVARPAYKALPAREPMRVLSVKTLPMQLPHAENTPLALESKRALVDSLVRRYSRES